MKTYNEITLIFIVENSTHLREDVLYFKTLSTSFSHTIPVIKKDLECSEIELPGNHESIVYEQFEDKVNGINRAVERVKTPWILILESDEKLRIEDLPTLTDTDHQSTYCYASRVESDSARDSGSQLNYQVRLIPNTGFRVSLFDGRRIFDISRMYKQAGWKLAEYVIPIKKRSSLFKAEDVKTEAISECSYLMQHYWKGIWHLENKKFNAAERCFRYIVTEKKPPFECDQLSAFNNLAVALYEQHLFDKAAQTARESLNKNRKQYTPYIILYKINELSGNLEKSYTYLKSYLNERRTRGTTATLDLTLPVEECHFLLAEISHKMGKYKRALTHYEQFHDLNKGQVSISVLERLFLYSIELDDYNKSVKYFYKTFGHYLSNTNQFTNDRLELESVLQALSLFMDNGWYEFVSNIYEQLVIQHPNNNKLLNKWITSLIKNNDFEKAQAIINKRAG